MSYMELKEQVDREVLLSDEYYNGIIQARIHHSHVKNLKKWFTIHSLYGIIVETNKINIPKWLS